MLIVFISCSLGSLIFLNVFFNRACSFVGGCGVLVAYKIVALVDRVRFSAVALFSQCLNVVASGGGLYEIVCT